MAAAPGGVRPPMGIMASGTGSPAMNPAMQQFAGGAPPGNTQLSSQQQQQLILNKMQQCMANVQKLQQMLTTGVVHLMRLLPEAYLMCPKPIAD